MKTLLATALLLLTLACVPASTAGPQKLKPLADLAVTNIVVKQLPGEPPYVIENQQGHTPGFAVYVTIRNVGTAQSKGCIVALDFTKIGRTVVRGLTRYLQPLRPRATHVLRFAVALDAHRAPPLGLLQIRAKADVGKVVREPDEDNNTRYASHLLPVIAEQWKATDFMVTENLDNVGFPGALVTDATKVCLKADCGRDFVFRFSTFDESSKHFEYIPSGTVRANWSYLYAPLNCTGSANEVRGPRDWPGSFWIDSELDYYDAAIDIKNTVSPPARGVITCNGNPALQLEWAFQDLSTYVGLKQTPRTDSPYDTKLTGHKEETSVAGVKTTWQWTFKADVPGA